jgi:predicted ATPase
VVVETQSDLVIRRVLRAMLEEDQRFPERVARIYFCALERVDDDFDQARIAPLALDERGHVKNWPEGFLDTSVKESGRLLRAMYGDSPKEEGDE